MVAKAAQVTDLPKGARLIRKSHRSTAKRTVAQKLQHAATIKTHKVLIKLENTHFVVRANERKPILHKAEPPKKL